MDDSLSAEKNMAIGKALAPLREDGDILLVGSGYTFHNMGAFFNPTKSTIQASKDFNEWLKDTFLNSNYSEEERYQRLLQWDKAPGGRMSHPREEHLLPLFMVAASSLGSNNSCTVDGEPGQAATTTQLIYDSLNESPMDGRPGHACTGYSFP
jgi:4,5-DOPA dioxygenase extradiol